MIKLYLNRRTLTRVASESIMRNAENIAEVVRTPKDVSIFGFVGASSESAGFVNGMILAWEEAVRLIGK